MKKFISIIALTMLSGIVLGQTKVGQLYYRITGDNTVSVVPELPRLPFYNAGNAPTGSVAIPQTVDIEGRTYTVTAIGESTFYDCRELKIEIPKTVTTIGRGAFNHCQWLREVIVNWATPLSVSDIFLETSLDYATLRVPIGKIEQYRQADVWKNFGRITDIRKVGQLYYQVMGENTVSVVKDSGEPVGNVTIPQTVELGDSTYTVTSIGEGAFSRCWDLTGVNIPSSVTSIGERAFSGCSKLTSINIPNSVTSIGERAFSGCSKLTSINIPNSVTSIGYAAFSDCSKLTSVGISTPIAGIEGYTFARCTSLTSIDIPNTVTSIGDNAFELCTSLTSINIPNSVTTIKNEAFESCTGLTSINIPTSVTSIGRSAFLGCTGLTSIDIPNSVTSLREDAFLFCSGLTSINVDAANPAYASQDGVLYNKDKTILYTCPEGKTGELAIPTSVTSINRGAFGGCKGLTSINIPNSVTSIGNWAFSRCEGLREVTVNWATPLAVAENVFNKTPINNVTLSVSAGTAEQYRQADVWKNFGHIVEATSSILSAVGNQDAITEVYNLRGERLSATNIDALPRGIYIVKKGGKAIKVVKP